MDFDTILASFGDFGPYQRKLFVFNAAFLVTVPFIVFAQVFISDDVDFVCLAEIQNGSSTKATSFRATRIAETKGGCGILENSITGNWSTIYSSTDHLFGQADNSTSSYSTDIEGQICAKWGYDPSQHQSTTVTEWNLVCDRKWLRELAQSAVYAGMTVGSGIFGTIWDRYGRLRSISSALLIQSIFCFLSAASPHLAMFIFCQFIVGCTYPGVLVASFTYVIEWTGPSKRAIIGNMLALMFPAGHMIFAVLSYFLRHWRLLQIVVGIPQLALLFVFLFRLIPESPRWLLSLGNVNEADIIIREAVRTNQKTLPSSYFTYTRLSSHGPNKVKTYKQETSSKSTTRTTKSYNFTDLFKTPKLRQTTLIILCNWFSVVLPYFGLSMFSTSLAGNRYVNFFLSGFAEVIAIFLSSFTINRWGRPRPIAVFCLIGGVFCFLSPFPKNGFQYLSIAFALIAKVGAAAAFWSGFVYVAELYPTVVGNSGFSLCILASRISTIIMPFMRLLSDVWQPLPYVIMGSMTASSGTLVLLAPETKNLCGIVLRSRIF
ncbi:organic cation transporter protein-like [Ptychodera flava]|uniref:organic cation transporter protein-like n=1 Tax=Ptychodera flava TaxID=63121 RepID=UPI00396A1773